LLNGHSRQISSYDPVREERDISKILNDVTVRL
jgi:hypothetical protein